VRTYRNLYPSIASFENLYLAYKAAAKGKRGHPEVATFEFNLDQHLLQLEAELRDRSYRPGPYRSFRINEPKPRLISAAPLRDRVVHHALVRVIGPLFESRFIHDSYANRLGKGTHRALDRCQAFARQHRYVLQCDIRQFFPSIDHAIVRGILARIIADEAAMELVGRILEGGIGVLSNEYDMVYFPGDDLFAIHRPRGLPIGNLTSQFWANVYLDELDQFVKRTLRVKAYVRYVDDFLLFDDDKGRLWTWKRAIVQFLARLRLTLHGRESTVYPVTNGIPFLGFRLYPRYRRLKRRNGVAFARRFRLCRDALERGQMTQEELNARVQGWVAHAVHGDTYGLRRALLSAEVLPRRVR